MPPPPRPATGVTSQAWTLEADLQDKPSVSDEVSISHDQIARLEKDRPNDLTLRSNCALKQIMTTSESCKEETTGNTSTESISPGAGPTDFTEDEPRTVRKGITVIDLTQDSTPKEGSSTITIEDLRREHWKKRGSLKAEGRVASDSYQHNSVATLPGGELPDDMPPPPAGFRWSKGQAGKWSLEMLQSDESKLARPTRVSTGVNAELLADRTRPKAPASVTDVDLLVVHATDESQPTIELKKETVRSAGRRVRTLGPHVRKSLEEQEAEWSAREAKKDVEHQKEQ